jgi:hypothetical protein
MLSRVVLVGTDVSEEVIKLLFTANVVPSSPILVTLVKEAIFPSETSVPTRAPQRNIPEDGIIHSHRSENFKLYILSSVQNAAFRRLDCDSIFRRQKLTVLTPLSGSHLKSSTESAFWIVIF